MSANGVIAWQKFAYPVGDIYEGEWNKEGRKHGYGMLVLTDGTKFVGKFNCGFCEGPGLLKFADGSSYAGQFKQGKYDGYGTFTRSDGMKFEGEFSNGRVEGWGLLTFPDGSHGRPRQEGYFLGTEIVKRQKGQESSDAVKKARDTASESAEIARNVVVKTEWGRGHTSKQ